MTTKTNEQIVADRIESDLLDAWPAQFFDIEAGDGVVLISWIHGPCVPDVKEIAYKYSADLWDGDASRPYVQSICLARCVSPEIMKELFRDVKKAWESVDSMYEMTEEFMHVYGKPTLTYIREFLDDIDLLPCKKCLEEGVCNCDEG